MTPGREVIPCNKGHIGGLLEEEREEDRGIQRPVPGDKNGSRETDRRWVRGGLQADQTEGNVANVHGRCS